MIDGKKLQVYFFFILFGAVSLLAFLVYQPFFQIIALSAIFAVLLDPFYKKILFLSRGQAGMSAVFVLAVTLVFIAMPIYFLAERVFSESQALYVSLQGNETDFMAKLTAAIERPVRGVYPKFSLDFGIPASNLAGLISRNIGTFVTGTAFAFFNIFIVIMSLFFFLKDGTYFVSGFTRLSPLDDKYNREILEKLKKTINYVLGSEILLDLIKGLLAGIGFFIFGIPNAAMWGVLAALAAPIPGPGTALVTIPGVLYLFLIGNTPAAIGLFLWAMLIIVILVGNFLAPMFYNRGIEVHPLFVFFSLLGGISFFGPLGFLFGPIVLSALLALLHIYRIFILEKKEEK